MADTKISALTTDSTPDRAADYSPTYDASAVATKKVLLQNYGAYVIQLYVVNASPADSTTYYFPSYTSLSLNSVAANGKTRIPRTGKVLAVYIDGIATVGSGESSTISFRLNDTTDTTVSSAVVMNATPFAFSNTGLAVAVTAGDYFNIKIVTPAWVTNPTGVYMCAQVFIA